MEILISRPSLNPHPSFLGLKGNKTAKKEKNKEKPLRDRICGILPGPAVSSNSCDGGAIAATKWKLGLRRTTFPRESSGIPRGWPPVCQQPLGRKSTWTDLYSSVLTFPLGSAPYSVCLGSLNNHTNASRPTAGDDPGDG